MKSKQEKEAQENQETRINIDQLTNDNQREKRSQSHKVISLYHHCQKKKEAGRAENRRKTKDSGGAKDSPELCVMCGRKTEYARETPIAQRRGYIEGVGQLCRRCFAEIYAEEQQ